MKLSVRACASAAAIVWGAAILFTGILNLVWSGYGVAFLDLARSIYPGYAGTVGFGGVIVGTLYGAADGAVAGAAFAWIYNRVVRDEA